MDVIHGWQQVPQQLKGASLAIGTFDGMHRGRRAIIDAAMKAAAGKLPMGVMLFEPYPRMFFQPQRPFFRLMSLSRKLELLSDFGCGFAAVIPFNHEVAGLSAEEFVRSILTGAFAIKHASVGYNFFF
jgi:riboflavin kinase / FMN adenylyltransferase